MINLWTNAPGKCEETPSIVPFIPENKKPMPQL